MQMIEWKLKLLLANNTPLVVVLEEKFIIWWKNRDECVEGGILS